MKGKKVEIYDKKNDSNYEGIIRDKLNRDRYLVEVTDGGGIEHPPMIGSAKIISAKNILTFISVMLIILYFANKKMYLQIINIL